MTSVLIGITWVAYASKYGGQALARSDAPDDAVRVAFSPGGASDLVIQVVGEARPGSQLLIAAYEFTSVPIMQAVVDAKRRGVDVRVVLDRTQAKAGDSSAKGLADADIPVRIDYVPAIMHDKFMVVNGETVETGSFNYTKAATFRNAENVIVTRSHPLEQFYASEWLRLWNEASPYQPT